MQAFAVVTSGISSSWATGSRRCEFTKSKAVRGLSPTALQRKSASRPAATSMGLLPLVPDWLTFGAWFYGAYRFYVGYGNTSYQPNYRIPLSMAWPIFAIFNSSYRKNFMKALNKGDD